MLAAPQSTRMDPMHDQSTQPQEVVLSFNVQSGVSSVKGRVNSSQLARVVHPRNNAGSMRTRAQPQGTAPDTCDHNSPHTANIKTAHNTTCTMSPRQPKNLRCCCQRSWRIGACPAHPNAHTQDATYNGRITANNAKRSNCGREHPR